MKTNRLTLFISLLASATVLSVLAYAGKTPPTDAVPAPKEPTVTITAPPAAAPVPVPAAPDYTSTRWSDIQDLSYDQRSQFFAGLKRLEAIVSAQVIELTAKRATMNAAANTKDWDFAMKEMLNAQVSLSSAGQELSRSNPEMWSQQREKVGQAWIRTQEAYKKVRSSTTID